MRPSPTLDSARPSALRDDAVRLTPEQLRHGHGLATALREPLCEGNQAELLLNGPATYAAMFAAIDAARDHINLESYIVEADGPGQELAERLIRKRREGVKVNLLFDHFGSLATAQSYFDALAAAGVRMCRYNPLPPHAWSNAFSRALHLRDHRKLLIVDGRVAFTGGINISGVYDTRAHSANERWQAEHMPWRDTHVRVHGPVVAQLQRLFIAHWQSQMGERPVLAHYFPPLGRAGDQRAATAACDAGRRRNPFYAALLRAVELAQRRVCITAAYFVPPRRLVRALCAAAERGVSVELVVPSISDSWAALMAGRSHYSRLLKSGVRVHERLEALLHAKTAVIDGVWATVGSSNMDWRSFLHNAEVNLIVLDEQFASQLETVFDNDIARSLEIELDEWRRRGQRQRMMEALARRFEFFL
jgi:cardiolipin synthase